MGQGQALIIRYNYRHSPFCYIQLKVISNEKRLNAPANTLVFCVDI